MNRALAWVVCLPLAIGAVSAAEPGQSIIAQVAPDRTLFDFESGTLAGWTSEGGEWTSCVLSAETINTWREDRRPQGVQGRFMLATGDTRHSKTRDGRLVSDEFEVTHDYLKFLLAGEVHPRVRVVLFVDGKDARVAYGNNAYDLRLRGWDVREFKGRRAQLVIEEGAEVDSLMRVDYFHLANTPPPDIGSFADQRRQESDVVRYGELRPIYQLEDKGFIKRTSLVWGADRQWHLFGGVAKGQWDEATVLFHAAASDLQGTFKTVAAEAMKSDPAFGEQWIREPFVLRHGGRFHCFYVGSGVPWTGWDKTNDWKNGLYGDKSTQGPFGIHLATSTDGNVWTRQANEPLFTDAAFAFTPFVTRVTNQWVMYYAGNEPSNIRGRHAIIARTSDDLIHWGERRVVFTRTATDAWPEHSFAHSPAVLRRGDYWYLLCGPMGNNNAARFHFRHLYRSTDPFAWEPMLEFGPLKGLFLEGGHSIVRDASGAWFITHDGAYAGGVWLALLRWNDGLTNPEVLLAPGASVLP